jgi:hypothetical protein
MQRLEREGVVQREALSFIETVDGSGELVAVQLQGRLFCPEREVAIRVAKRMEVRRGAANRYEVRTVSYAYHAWVRRRGPGAARRNLPEPSGPMAESRWPRATWPGALPCFGCMTFAV